VKYVSDVIKADSCLTKFLIIMCILFQLADDEWEFENIVLERVSMLD